MLQTGGVRAHASTTDICYIMLVYENYDMYAVPTCMMEHDLMIVRPNSRSPYTAVELGACPSWNNLLPYENSSFTYTWTWTLVRDTVVLCIHPLHKTSFNTRAQGKHNIKRMIEGDAYRHPGQDSLLICSQPYELNMRCISYAIRYMCVRLVYWYISQDCINETNNHVCRIVAESRIVKHNSYMFHGRQSQTTKLTVTIGETYSSKGW